MIGTAAPAIIARDSKGLYANQPTAIVTKARELANVKESIVVAKPTRSRMIGMKETKRKTYRKL